MEASCPLLLSLSTTTSTSTISSATPSAIAAIATVVHSTGCVSRVSTVGKYVGRARRLPWVGSISVLIVLCSSEFTRHAAHDWRFESFPLYLMITMIQNVGFAVRAEETAITAIVSSDTQT